MPNWTKGQQDAIEDRGSNLLIAAAAGSGKTAVLVERIIRLITEDKIDIDRLLIVTFTNAAASEMRERIGTALIKELEKKNENEDHLRNQITLLNRASIITIHSFCIEVVRKHFHLIDIDPSFRIGDTMEINILKQESMEEMLEREYEKGEKLFFDLVESFGGNRDDVSLQQLIDKMYTFIQSQPKPIEWLIEKAEEFNITTNSFGNSPWVDTLKTSMEVQLLGAKDLLNDARKMCLKPYGPEGYLKAIESDMALVETLLSDINNDFDNIFYKLTNIEFVRLGRLSKETDSDLKEQAKDLRDNSKKIIKGITDKIFLRKPEEYIEELKSIYPLMKYLCLLIQDYTLLYREKKLEKGIVDFNDLEHYALTILENENVAREYKDKFIHIFIDEYQDSNIVQETLINFIKRKNNLFMVGDVKQSIYRFRLADPSLFIEKYEEFSTEKGELNRKIDLSKNFRSRKDIISGVNYIFKNIMTKQLGEIDYSEEAYLYPGGSFQPMEDTAIELNLIEKDSKDLEEAVGEDLEELGDIEVEAKIIAQRIKKALNSEIYDPKKEVYRKVEFKDIVILLRTTQNWAHVFLDTLIKENIPTYADIGTGYFESIEISIFINLMKIIDNKRQDIPLISVMRSPIGNFTLEELVEIRLMNKKGTFFEAMMKFIEDEEGDMDSKLFNKIKIFLHKLNSWSEMSKHMNINELIWKLFMETGYYYYVGAMPGGFQRQANLRVLLDRAVQFEKTSIRGLFNFIKFIEKIQGSKGDMGDAKILGESDNVVRIMSIHKSKGLEFPLVILAGTGKKFNLTDVNANMLLHKDLGIGPKFVDLNLRVYRDTIIKLAMKDKLEVESLSEEMRILYVALTRPIDKLIIFGSVKELKKQIEKWCRPLNSYLISSARSYIDWIGMVLTKHPELKSIRSLTDINLDDEELIEDSSKWTCNIYKRSDVILNKLEEDMIDSNIKENLLNYRREDDSIYKKVVNERLSWQYPYEEATRIPSKLSVSEIKNANKVDSLGYSIPPLIIKPKFLEGKKEYTKAEKGTIIHFIMQHIDLSKLKEDKDVKLQVEEMISKEIITEEEIMEIDLNKITLFFNSDLGERMLSSNKVNREVSFNMKRKAQEVIGSLQISKENLLIQGTVDCYFEEEEEIVLVDYKSDEVTEINDVTNIIKRYDVQLRLYKEALERILGKRVKESYIYLFDINEEVLV